MKKILMAAVAAMTMAVAGGNIEVAEVPAPVVEKTGIYAGVAYTYTDTTVNDIQGAELASGTANAASLAIGYNVLPYLAIEGRYSFIAEDTYTYSDGSSDELDGTAWSLFLKPQYAFGDIVVYGLLGAGQVELGDVYSSTGFQYGAGLAYNINEDFLVFADYTKLADDEDFVGSDITANVDAFNIGVAYKF